MRQGHGIGWTKSRCSGKGLIEVIKKFWRPVLHQARPSAGETGSQPDGRTSGAALDLLHQLPSTIMRTRGC